MQNDKDPELNDTRLLSGMKRTPFLNAPDGYFESLGNALHQRTTTEQAVSNTIWNRKTAPLFITALAAMIACVTLLFRPNDQAQPKSVLSYDDLVNTGYVYDYD